MAHLTLFCGSAMPRSLQRSIYVLAFGGCHGGGRSATFASANLGVIHDFTGGSDGWIPTSGSR